MVPGSILEMKPFFPECVTVTGQGRGRKLSEEIPPPSVRHSVKGTHRKGHFSGVLTFSFLYFWACLPPGVSPLI